MDVIIYVTAAIFVAILLIIVTFVRNSNTEANHADNGEAAAQVARARPVQGGAEVARAGGRRRVRQRLVRQREDDSDEEGEEEPAEDFVVPDGKVGAKKMAKLQAKADKRANREAELHEREEKQKREEKSEASRKKLEAKEAAFEKEQKEEEERQKKEQEEKDHEEYLKMKAMFSVEEEGTYEEELNQDTESLLQEFINYIKDMKVIMLEDLAAHFKIRTQDAIDRVTTLMENGTIQGVLDDRGKFIYITQEEFQAVARFIQQRGRVSISELADSSNQLINLAPENTDTLHRLVGAEAS